MKGVIKNVVPGRYFGFITGEDGKEYFFHKDEFMGHWDDLEGDFYNKKPRIPVELDTKETPKGWRATNVRRTDHPNEGPSVIDNE